MKQFSKLLKIGLIVGILDGVAACVNAYIKSGITPDRVFKYIASGVFGSAAFKGDTMMIVWGCLFHLTIAIIWTIIFYWVFRYFKLSRYSFLLNGLAFGIIIWALMQFVVVPLSGVPPLPFSFKGAVVMIFIHMFVIGIPMAYLFSKNLKGSNA